MTIETGPENSRFPGEFDAVLGGDATAALGSVVLGGLSGLKSRFEQSSNPKRARLIQAALQYGAAGLEWAIAALKDESDLVQRAAYLSLRDRAEPSVRQALQSFNPYRFFTCLRTLKGGGLQAMLSHQAEAIAVVGGKTIKAWDLQNGDLLYTVPRYSSNREYFIASSDRQTLVRSTSADQHRVEVWKHGELAHTLYGHEAPIRALAMSVDQQMVATGSDDRTIRIWQLSTGRSIWTIEKSLTRGTHMGPICSLVFTPDGSMLVSASIDGTIKVWNLPTRDRLRTCKTPGDIRTLAISRDGRWLAGAHWRKILIWDLQAGQIVKTFEGHAAEVRHLNFSPDGLVLASCDHYNSDIYLWNLETGRVITTLVDHGAAISALGFNGDGQTFISCSADKTIRFWGVSPL